MLTRVMHSARIREHPRLTVSTEAGMLHYELQPQSQTLFLAITQPDMKQSAAFAFLLFSAPTAPSTPLAYFIFNQLLIPTIALS